MNFQQKAKVGVAGNLINQLMANNSTLPEVGKGATELMYSDRHCYEVIEVSEDYKTVKIESLSAKHDPSKEGGMGHQNWILEPTGQFSTVVWRNNKWKVKSTIIDWTKEFCKKADATGKNYYQVLTEEEFAAVYGEEIRPSNIVEGITEYKTVYNPIKLIWGTKDYRYDWEF